MTEEKRETTKGKSAEDADISIDPITGMQKDYVVLSAEERAMWILQLWSDIRDWGRAFGASTKDTCRLTNLR